uniref:UM033_0004.1 n=1 Tax=Ulva compressa TaxID=63659 RepID=A0A8J9T3P1_ULVCO|nr:UM033_0004.1 [Ulva compressa]|eukprot:jgi/Ulvmu1/6947/UM033_0004.1
MSPASDKHDAIQRPTTAPRQNPFSSSLFAPATVRSPNPSIDRSRASRVSQASRPSDSRTASRQLETHSVAGSIDGSPRAARHQLSQHDLGHGAVSHGEHADVGYDTFAPSRKGQPRQPVPPLGLPSTASATSSMNAPVASAAARSATTHSEIASLGPISSSAVPPTSSPTHHLQPHAPQRPLPRGSGTGSLLSPARPHAFQPRHPSDSMRPLPHRGSDASSRASGASRSVRSRNASCALENIDDPLGTRPSMDAFGSQMSASFAQPLDSHAVARAVAVLRTLPQEVISCARILSAFNPDCLLPAQVLAKIWRVDIPRARGMIQRLSEAGIVRHATLANGSVWCVPTTSFSSALKHEFEEEIPAMHAAVLAVYEDRPGFTTWAAVKDDGFIALNLISHLAANRRLEEMRSVLQSPSWLEQKTHLHGPSAVVKDLQTAIRVDDDFASAGKLLLQAFTMSEAVALAMPHPGTLIAQMLARTAAVCQLPGAALDSGYRDWWEQQVSQLESAVASNFRSVSSIRGSSSAPTPVHLLPKTATLAQACGSTRLILKGHTGPVTAAFITDDMRDVVSASVDGVVRVFDLHIGSVTTELSNKTKAPLTHLEPAGKRRVVTLSQRCREAVVWDLQEGKCALKLTGATDCLTCLHVHPKGTTALIGTESGAVHMFSLMDGTQELRMCANNERITALAVAWYVSGALSSPVAASACSSGTLHVWDLMGESEDLPICTLTGHNGAVPCATFFRRGERLATASHDGTAAVWDIVTGLRIGVLAQHTGRVNHVEVEPLREELLLTCSDDGLAAVWHAESCTQAALLQGHDSFVTVANFVPAGDRGEEAHRTFVATASGDGTVAVWDALSGERIQVLAGHSAEVTALHLCHTGRYILSSSTDGTCHLWDLHSQVVDLPVPHRGGIRALQSLPNAEFMLSFGKAGTVQQWDCSTMDYSYSGSLDAVTDPSPPIATAASADGRLVASCAANSHTIVRDVASLAVVLEMAAVPGSRVKSVSFSGDCSIMAVVLFDSSVTLWHLQRQEVMWQPQARGMMDGLEGHSAGVNACFLSQRGDLLVTLSKDHTARAWNVITRTAGPVFSGHSASVSRGWLSKEGELLITGSEDSTARVWDVATGRNTLVLAHKQPVVFVVGSQSRRRAFTCTGSAAAWLWNVEDGSCTSVLRLGEGPTILSGLFLQESRLVVTRHAAASIGVWHVGSGALIAFFACDDPVEHIACTPRGMLALGTQSGAMHFIQLPVRSAPRSFASQTTTVSGSGPPAVLHAAGDMYTQPKVAKAPR